MFLGFEVVSFFFYTYGKMSDHLYVYNTTVGWDVPSPTSPFSKYHRGCNHDHQGLAKENPASKRGCTCEHLGHGENNAFGTAG
jgi:hypothetical protein